LHFNGDISYFIKKEYHPQYIKNKKRESLDYFIALIAGIRFVVLGIDLDDSLGSLEMVC